MTTWTENLKDTVDIFLNGLVDLHKEHDPESSLYASLAQSYKDEIHKLYKEDLVVASLLDSSHLVAQYSSDFELNPTFSLVSSLCSNLHGAITKIAESIFHLRSASAEKINWPKELTPNLSGMVPGSMVLGVRIGTGEPPKQDMFPDDLQIMVDDVESALDGVAAIGQHLDGGALSQEFQDKYQDPATRDIILAAASKLAPSSRGAVQEVVFRKKNDQNLEPIPLTRDSRKVLRQELSRPEKKAKEGAFSGLVRAVDLDSNRFTLRRVSEWGSIRCVHRTRPERQPPELRRILNATVRVSGVYESAPGDYAPRLMHVDEIDIITPAAEQNELELVH